MQIRSATPDDVPAVVAMVKKLTALHEGWDPSRYAVREDVAEMYHHWLTDKCDDDRAVFEPLVPLSSFWFTRSCRPPLTPSSIR